MSAARDNLVAIGLMCLGMAGFAGEDFLIKSVSGAAPLWLLLTVLAGGGAILFGGLCLARGLPLVSRDLGHPLVLARNASESIASVCYIGALALIPLSLTSAILQVTPLFVTAGAALWLGERVGWRRWLAVVAGLSGVLIILRPGLEGFRPAALLVVASAICLAVRDISSRHIPARISTFQLSFWAYLALLPGAALIYALNPAPGAVGAAEWRTMGLAVVVGALAYAAITAATRLGDASAIVPFRYTRLIFALILGMAFLGERPDVATLLGAAIVVASGLYALLRERKR